MTRARHRASASVSMGTGMLVVTLLLCLIPFMGVSLLFAPQIRAAFATLTVDTAPPALIGSNPAQNAVLKTFDQTFRFWAKFSEPVGVYLTIEAVVGTNHFPSDRFYSGGGGVLYDSVNGYFYVTYETVKASNGYFTQPPNTGTWTIDIIAEDAVGNRLHTIIAFTVDPFVTPQGSWTVNGQVVSSSSTVKVATSAVTYVFSPTDSSVVPFITSVTVESQLGTNPLTSLTLTKQADNTWKGTTTYADGTYTIHGYVTDTKGNKILQFSIVGGIGATDIYGYQDLIRGTIGDVGFYGLATALIVLPIIGLVLIMRRR